MWGSGYHAKTGLHLSSPSRHENSIQHTPSEEFQLGIMPKCLRIHGSHGKYYSKGTWLHVTQACASWQVKICHVATKPKTSQTFIRRYLKACEKWWFCLSVTKVSKNVQSNAIRALATTQRNVQISNQPSVEAHMPWKGTFGTHPVLAANDFGALVWMSWIQWIFVAFRFLF